MKSALFCALVLLASCSKSESSKDPAAESKTKSSEDKPVVEKVPAEVKPVEIIPADAALPKEKVEVPAEKNTEVAEEIPAEPVAEKEKVEAAAAASGPSNLKVLPAKWSEKKVKASMKKMTRGLGVKCSHCHVKGDFASDDNKNKKMARSMLAMTRKLDRKYMKGKGLITCYTCHKGKKTP